jgi:hypothetical protein
MTMRKPGYWSGCLLVCVLATMLLNAQAQQPTTTPLEPNPNPYAIGRIFSQGIPTGYQLQHAGELPANEGGGSYLIIQEPNQQIMAVLVDIEDMGWLKTTRLKSANPVTVAQHLLSQYFPNQPKTKVTENKAEKPQHQLATHLLLTDASHQVTPAITLRLLYPQNRAVILLLWQSDKQFPNDTQDFSSLYQFQETQAQSLINEIRVSGTRLPTERYILWRLRHIFKTGVFSHPVEQP